MDSTEPCHPMHAGKGKQMRYLYLCPPAPLPALPPTLPAALNPLPFPFKVHLLSPSPLQCLCKYFQGCPDGPGSEQGLSLLCSSHPASNLCALTPAPSIALGGHGRNPSSHTLDPLHCFHCSFTGTVLAPFRRKTNQALGSPFESFKIV